VVGHDWGAVAGYAAAALEPGALRALVALAVPPPRAIVRNLRRDPRQLRRSAYMGLARLPGGAHVLRARNYALIERLWRRWSPGWSPDPQHLARIKHTFDYPGTPEAALAYYRGLLSARPWVWARTVALLTRPLEVPTLVLGGEDDGCLGRRLFAGAEDAARASLRLSLLPGVGHWPHLEQPDAAHAAILDWARQHAPAPRPLPRAT
jgi:pimeloyl-ACP methyl ester carboxylesterase